MHKPPTTNLRKACWLLAGLLARWMACLLAPWLACSLVCCLACLLSCLLLGWLTCLLASCCHASWLLGCLADLLACSLHGLLACLLPSLLPSLLSLLFWLSLLSLLFWLSLLSLLSLGLYNFQVFVFFGCFFCSSVWGTPCYLLHFGANTSTLLNFGAKICHLHCSSIFPWF